VAYHRVCIDRETKPRGRPTCMQCSPRHLSLYDFRREDAYKSDFDLFRKLYCTGVSTTQNSRCSYRPNDSTSSRHIGYSQKQKWDFPVMTSLTFITVGS